MTPEEEKELIIRVRFIYLIVLVTLLLVSFESIVFLVLL